MESVFTTVQQQKELPLSEKVANQIRDVIRERNIGIGDKLPSEFELAESLNVGRGTIREAVKLLVARNYLEIRRGKGTYVTENLGHVDDPFGFDFVTDKLRLAEELYEIRVHIEPWIASLAAQRILADEKEELRQLCAAVEEKILAGEDHGEEDLAFHQYIAQCTHNSVLPEMIPIITYSVRFFTHIKDPEALRRTIMIHRAITDAICANDSEVAQARMLDHMASNLNSIEELRDPNRTTALK